jgi:hypothetical protein
MGSISWEIVTTIIGALLLATTALTGTLLVRRSAVDKTKVDATVAETASRAQIDEATGNLIERQTAELGRFAARVKALEDQVIAQSEIIRGLQKTIETALVKDKIISDFTVQVAELNRQLIAQQSIINQYAASRITSIGPMGPVGPAGPAGPAGG